MNWRTVRVIECDGGRIEWRAPEKAADPCELEECDRLVSRLLREEEVIWEEAGPGSPARRSPEIVA